MGKTVSEIERLDANELNGWIAYNNIEPIGDVRQDLRFALMTAHLISPHLKKGYHPKVKDYMFDFWPKPKMSNADMKAVLMGLTHG